MQICRVPKLHSGSCRFHIQHRDTYHLNNSNDNDIHGADNIDDHDHITEIVDHTDHIDDTDHVIDDVDHANSIHGSDNGRDSRTDGVSVVNGGYHHRKYRISHHHRHRSRNSGIVIDNSEYGVFDRGHI